MKAAGLPLSILTALLVAALLVANLSLFVVDQTHVALVLQFGEVKRVINEPGLSVKIPFIQTVVQYDKRLLDFEPPPEEVIAADQKRLVVDSYARYRIVDPLLFYQAAGTEDAVRLRLGATLNGSLRRVLGGEVLGKLLSPDRPRIMGAIRDEVASEAKSFGIEVVDVRIRRADLPSQNSDAIFGRMKSERQREATQYRAEGYEAAQTIRANADREVTVIRAEADKAAQTLRGQGDADAIRIAAEAYGRDPEFFAFYRSLDAYKAALGPDTTLVLSPDSDFFRFLQHRALPGQGPAGQK